MNVKEEVKKKDEKYFGRGKPAMDLEETTASGSLIYDSNSKEYIDFLGGSGVGSLGWDLPELEQALRNTNRPSYVHPNFYYEPWINLAELLAELTPNHLTKSFRATGGSEAIEAAMQIAMLYTGRKKFISIEGSYHGNTLGALSIGASSNRETFPNLLNACEKIETPLDEKALEKAEKLLKNNEVAAFIMEPIICNLGVVIPENDFMENLAKLCKQHGTLLVMDEAITGFGRTGKFFATEHFNINPDIMCVAKAFSAGHAGIGAIITTDEIAQKVEGKVGLYSSYGWHPVSTDVAIATIEYLQKNKHSLFQNIERNSEIFKTRLSKISFKNNAEVRIKGLAIGIDVKDNDYASNIKNKCLENGLLLDSEGSSLVLFPPLNIEEELVKKGLDILSKCVD